MLAASTGSRPLTWQLIYFLLFFQFHFKMISNLFSFNSNVFFTNELLLASSVLLAFLAYFSFSFSYFFSFH